MYDQMSYYYYGQYKESEFDGEGQLTSAIDYVINDVTKKIYTTEGHGESALSSTVTDLLKNRILKSFCEFTSDCGIPKDCTF